MLDILWIFHCEIVYVYACVFRYDVCIVYMNEWKVSQWRSKSVKCKYMYFNTIDLNRFEIISKTIRKEQVKHCLIKL